jgi:type VI protein secretion system component Hcp
MAAAIVAAILMAAPEGAQAAAIKPPPTIGQLVLDGGPASPVTGFSWSVTADSSWTKGGGASVGKPNPDSIHFVKSIDPSSVPTLQKITTGDSYSTAVFTMTFGKGNTAATMTYEMQELFATNVTQGGANGLVFEDAAFVFKTVKWTHRDASGNVTTGGWNITGGPLP